MESHLYALLELAKRSRLDRVYVHFFSDGRDTPPRSALTYLERLEKRMADLGIGKVASVMGRYYAMDRDRNWARTKLAYEALTQGTGYRAVSGRQAIEAAYGRADEAIRKAQAAGREVEEVVETDEFIRPTLIADDTAEPLGLIKPGDSVIFFNYRQDRAIQISMAFVEADFDQPDFKRGPRLDIAYLGLTRYYDSFDHYVLPPMDMSNLLGEVLAEHGLWQLRISETQKFRHVTSFFNSKREEPFPGEERVLVASPRGPEDQKPEMSAYEVTELVLTAISDGIGAMRQVARTTEGVTLCEAGTPASNGNAAGTPAGNLDDTYDVIILNYVNGDMVGHTGVLEAAVKAIEVVDECVGRVIDAVLARGGVAIVTADHGNAEQMVDPETGEIQTAHTTNEVDLIYVGSDAGAIELRPRGILSDIAPTMLQILGISQPAEMTARSLLL